MGAAEAEARMAGKLGFGAHGGKGARVCEAAEAIEAEPAEQGSVAASPLGFGNREEWIGGASEEEDEEGRWLGQWTQQQV
jgi:hypothetical protein